MKTCFIALALLFGFQAQAYTWTVRVKDSRTSEIKTYQIDDMAKAPCFRKDVARAEPEFEGRDFE